MEPDDEALVAHEPQQREIAAIVRLGESLHGAGAPAGRLEDVLTEVARTLGIRIHVFATVTCLIIAFGVDSQRTVLIRLEPRDLNLGQLVRLDALVDRCMHRTRSADDLTAELKRFERANLGTPALVTIATRCAGAAAWTLLLGGTWRAAFASGLAGVAVGVLTVWLSNRDGTVSAELPACAAAATGAIVALANLLWGPLPFQLASMAALLPLLPGLPLVIGVEDLASRDLLAGSSRLLAAGLVFLQLAFALALGSALLPSVQSVPVHPPPAWMQAVLLPCAVRVLALQLSVADADLSWVFAAALLGYACTRLGSALLGVELGAFLGALLIGLFANAVARWAGRPALLIAVPGMFALWPGALGFQTVNALWSNQTSSGVRHGLTVLMTAVGAVTGLLVASRLLPPRRTL
jgi:uncharacterized membrane protein YjjP (DUF1212 family)